VNVEIREFESHTGELAQQLGYEWRIKRLVDEVRQDRAEAMRLGHVAPRRRAVRFWRRCEAAATIFYKLPDRVEPT
jgi:hypothetical protein